MHFCALEEQCQHRHQFPSILPILCPWRSGVPGCAPIAASPESGLETGAFRDALRYLLGGLSSRYGSRCSPSQVRARKVFHCGESDC